MKIMERARFDELLTQFDKIGPIAIVGDSGIDKYTQGEVRRISPEAPVPVVEVQKEWEKLGLAANIGHNLKDLGIDSTLCSVIGEDLRAPRFDDLLEDSGLKTWGIVRDAARPTIFKERITTSTQQVCRIDYEDKQNISPEVETKLLQRVQDFLEDHTALILEDYSKGTLTEKVIKDSIEMGKSAGKMVCVDPGVSTDPLFYKGCTLLKPNLKEAKLMVEHLGKTYSQLNLQDMASFLMDKLELEKLVITLGPEGMALMDRSIQMKEIEIIPTAAQEVYDVSGAGDTTISLLTAGLLAGATLSEAAFLGNCGAGVVVAKKGTATVNRKELVDFYFRLVQSSKNEK
ncbi:MAG: D-glycero-beta-D-manno-heptose-7-phosphate kinase [Halobacteriovoraceae bacterium]|nr:D-glycero-beta-D-manno-heptose-7-phosphate kinase [Halobacteriovoraceae bacterium]|tara:strand:+ start:83577 stop:84611 length:1035 start_codon:yes stop_codon:yes gene_type:complete